MKMVPAPPPTSSSSPMMSSSQHQKFEVTEDTPVDFLEGCMEILVVFPNEKSILMSIQRRMPMLDLLIHVTAANKISPAAHLLQVTDEEGRLLPHKPSTPIGSLNAHKVYIVSKNRLMSDRSTRSTKSSATTSQFEQSFRVQVRLPRNQLFVTRVTGRTQLGDLLHTVCNEKALDPRHYELRHPVNQDERLRLSNCLDDYKLQEVVLVPSGGKISQQQTVLSVHDLPTTMNKKSVTVSNSSVGGGASKMPGKSALRSTSSEATLAHTEKKKRGLFGLLGFGKHKKGSSMGDSSISSDSAGDRSISPSRSEEPPAPPPPEQPVVPTPPSPVLVSKRLAEEAVAKRNSRLSQMSAEAAAQSPLRTTSNGVAPARPAAKKKRAPPPPSSEPSPPPPTAVTEKTCSEVSSSSSTSVIHQVETTRSKSPSEESGSSSPKTSNLLTTPAVSSSNLTQVSSTSNASLASAIKKRKAPVPPPALREQAEADQVNGSHHHHDESDRASSVSDQMSSVSDMSSPVKSATPEVSVNKEEEHEEEEELDHSGLDSPRSSAAASPDAISGRPVDTPSEDDYEVLNYKKQEEQVEVKAEEEKVNSGTYSQAQENEEIVISEPIYTMVIKSPKPLRAVDWDEKINAEPDKIIPTADDNRAEEEAEPEERNAGDGQTESPVMWEYKLPAPPTPFQDSGDSPMDKLQFASVTESNHSRPGSSMSADSLQEQSSADEEEVERPKIVTGIDTTVELCHGKELVEESNTEDVPLDCSTDVVEQVVVLEPSDPEAKQFGIESTTDEQPLSLPPAVPSTLPPCDSEDSSLQSEMKFSIATYNIRTTEDSTYDKKLSRSNSPDEMPANLIASPIEDNEPISVAIETKEPDVVSDAAAKTSGTVPNVQPNVPLINADLMQQFQNSLFVLHSISDPKARALQEEFLRLQQQLLTLQMQSVVQQANEIVSPVTQPTVDVPDKSPVVEEVEKVDIVPTTNTESKVVEPVSSPPESITDSSLEIKSEETSTETDIPVYRYTGPPQVKLDTWKPGRPRSEIVDYSRSSSFNVPLAPAVEQPIIAKPVEKSLESAPMPPPAVSNEVSEPAPLSLILEEETKSVIIESNDNSMEEKADGGGSPIDPKPVVLRKSSFLTARPFEARPSSMPIKRPTFTPMIIQPVPFVSRKIRAPEVRGFASLPPVTTNEMAAPVRMTTPTGPAPFSAVNKPRSISVVSKENPTIAIRNKLIESARRPSAELNGAPFKNEISSIPVNNESETKESTPNVIELRRNSTSNRPINMPVSSSLLLAAGAGVQKSQPVIIPESVNPIVTATTAPPQQSVIPPAAAADPVSTNARRSLSSKFVRKVDPREELLNSIRNFANGGSLRKTGTNLEN